MKKKVATINVRPKWAGIVPVLLEVYSNGATPEGRKEAKENLIDLARKADDIVALQDFADNFVLYCDGLKSIEFLRAAVNWLDGRNENLNGDKEFLTLLQEYVNDEQRHNN